jgi:hypothetical protein
MGLRFEQGRHCDNGICAVGRWDLVKIWHGLGNGNRTIQDPLFPCNLQHNQFLEMNIASCSDMSDESADETATWFVTIKSAILNVKNSS